MINTALLDKCLDAIVSKPQNWYQSTWISAKPVYDIPEPMLPFIEEGKDAMCGTTACLAGHAMQLSGNYKTVITNVMKDIDGKVTNYSVMMVDKNDEDNIVCDDDIEWMGRDLLGLEGDLAHRLFHMTDSMDPKHFAAWVRETIAAFEAGRDIYGVEPWDIKYQALYTTDEISSRWY